MILSDIPELTLYSVENRGVPNSERVAIFVNEDLNMGQYGLMLGNHVGEQRAIPIKDAFFWFGDGVVREKDWLIVYTGRGETQVHKNDQTGGNIFYLYWERDMTMFTNSNIVPILFRMDAVTVDAPPNDKPQKLGIDFTSS